MTLIELMIVVAIIGILASVAVFMYSKSTKKSKISTEVAGMFAEFKVRQEAFQLENSVYLNSGNVGQTEDDRFPATPGGTNNPTIMGDASNPLPTGWRNLRMNPDKSAVYCSYVAVAGNAGDGTTGGTIATSEFAFVPPNANWYYLLAECDMNDDGGGATSNAIFFARSDREGIAKVREGQ